MKVEIEYTNALRERPPAFVAYSCLLGGVKENIIYHSGHSRRQRMALDGGHKYIMRWEKADLGVSQNGVWSVSQYRENFYVSHQIGSGMPLKYNSDGSLDVTSRRICRVRTRSPSGCCFPQAAWST